MDDLTVGFNDYGEFKATLGAELKANVEGFVRIGYLLKVARDTDILKESGHRNVAEFAAAEYGLTKDIVSRYIAINDRYSEGGYSDRLQAKFEGYGVSKLQEMLTLPDYIIDEITPTLTRAEIQEIKAEVKAENEITPIEVAIEAAAPEVQKEEKELTFSMRVWKQYFSADTSELEREKFLRLSCQFYKSILTDDTEVKQAKEKFFDVFGGRIVWARIPGVGRIMISVSDEAEDKIVYTNSRTGEKQELKSIDALNDIKELIAGRGCTSDVFDELFREKKEEPKPGSWTYDQPKTKSVQPESGDTQNGKTAQDNAESVQKPGESVQKPGESCKNNAKTEDDSAKAENDNADTEEKSVQNESENIQGDADNEKECSKKTADNRSESNEDRKVPEGAEGSGDNAENDRDKEKALGKLETGDRIVNLKDGTKGTMLGYCAGEYKISTENGLILVNEKSTGWKKEEEAEQEERKQIFDFEKWHETMLADIEALDTMFERNYKAEMWKKEDLWELMEKANKLISDAGTPLKIKSEDGGLK